MYYFFKFYFLAYIPFVFSSTDLETQIEQQKSKVKICYGTVCSFNCLKTHFGESKKAVDDSNLILDHILLQIEELMKSLSENSQNFTSLSYKAIMTVFISGVEYLEKKYKSILADKHLFGMRVPHSQNPYAESCCECINIRNGVFDVSSKSLNSLREIYLKIQSILFKTAYYHSDKTTDKFLISELYNFLLELQDLCLLYSRFNARFLDYIESVMKSENDYEKEENDLKIKLKKIYQDLILRKYECIFSSFTFLFELFCKSFEENLPQLKTHLQFQIVILQMKALKIQRPYSSISFRPIDITEAKQVIRAIYQTGTSITKKYLVCLGFRLTYRFLVLDLQKKIGEMGYNTPFLIVMNITQNLLKSVSILETENMLGFLNDICNHLIAELLSIKRNLDLDFTPTNKSRILDGLKHNPEIIPVAIKHLPRIYMYFHNNMVRLLRYPNELGNINFNVCFGYLCMEIIQNLEEIEKILWQLREYLTKNIQTDSQESVQKKIYDATERIIKIIHTKIKVNEGWIRQIWCVGRRFDNREWGTEKELLFLKDFIYELASKEC